jgi:hypothetical protein
LYFKGALRIPAMTLFTLVEGFRVSPQNLHENSWIIPRLTHNRSLPDLYHSSSTRRPTTRCYIVCNAYGVVKQTTTKTNIKLAVQISHVCHSFVGLDRTHLRTGRKFHNCCQALHLTDSSKAHYKALLLSTQPQAVFKRLNCLCLNVQIFSINSYPTPS